MTDEAAPITSPTEEKSNADERPFRISLPRPSMAYSHVDAFQACRVGEAFAVTMFQFDYQTMVDVDLASQHGAEKPDVAAIPVVRIVTDLDGIRRLQNELTSLLAKLGAK